MSSTAVQALNIRHRISHDNLHIHCQSPFDLPQVAVLISLLRHHEKQCKRVFIDVTQIGNPHPAAANVLKSALLHEKTQGGYTPQRIIFKGSGGFALGIDGNRVLIMPKRDVKNKKSGQSVADALAHKRREAARKAHPCTGHGYHAHHEHGHVCKGNCANCRCGHKKEAQSA